MTFKTWKQLKNNLPKGVKLLAVSKGHSAEDIHALAHMGQIDFGESRLQEALPKLDLLKNLIHIKWHFIGKLQSNKVRAVIKNFEIIHSVDSLALAERISRIAGEEKKCPSVMFQVKLAEDPNKSGFQPKHLLNSSNDLFALPNIKCIGLMTMAPKNLDKSSRRNLFCDCRMLANKLHLDECSMGMSQDWEEAVVEGATWIRLGSFLFGDRPKNIKIPTDITKNT